MFTDATGHRWETEIDLPGCRRVRDLVGINLLTLHLSALLNRLSDPITLCEVLWALCKPEADRLGLDLDAFLKRCAVQLAPITDSLLTGPGGLADFFRRLGQEPKAQELTTIWTRLQTLQTMRPEKTAELIDQTVDWMIHRILNESSGSGATSTPASPA